MPSRTGKHHRQHAHTQRNTITPAEIEHQSRRIDTNATHTPGHKPSPSTAIRDQIHPQPRQHQQDHRPRRPTHAAHRQQSPTHQSRSTPAAARRAYARPPSPREAHATPPTRHKATPTPHQPESQAIEVAQHTLYARHAPRISATITQLHGARPPPLRSTR